MIYSFKCNELNGFSHQPLIAVFGVLTWGQGQSNTILNGFKHFSLVWLIFKWSTHIVLALLSITKPLSINNIDWNKSESRSPKNSQRIKRWTKKVWKSDQGPIQEKATRHMKTRVRIHCPVSLCAFIGSSFPLGHRANPSLWDWKGNH